ncbi:PAS domain-containing protein [Mucilaginibacter roseus]|uniref:histidine kinase n=1 Tax=Mucilaginibacter roseus TaxID=1528868 RepID=A0ABS8TYW6_9SPHI|nr:PAS domain-containing protein [Mucilaginibacter roseus]MCD8739008.1 PAS domain-containing protein [Mucilaginibacter roseus]
MNKTRLLSSDQLLDIFSGSHIATAIYTTEDLIIEAVTEAMLHFWGKTRDIVGLPLEIAVPELVGQPFIEQMRGTFQTGKIFSGKSVPAVLENNGRLQTSYYDYEYRPLKNADGRIYCMIHTASDVTDAVSGRKAVEKEQQHLNDLENEQALNEELAAANEELSAINEELQQTQEHLNQLNAELEDRVTERTASLESSEAKMRYLIDDAPVAIAVLSGPNFIVEQANQYILKIWGKSSAVIGQTIYDALPEIEGQAFFPILENVYASGEAYYGSEAPGLMEYDGDLRQIFTNFVFKPITDESGETHSVMIVATEVTEQVLANKAIGAAKYRLEAMVQTTPVAMTILSGRELVIEQANAAMYEIWQRNAGQTLGKRLIDVFPELVGQPFPELLARVFDTAESIAFPELPVLIKHPDGSEKNIYVNFSYDPIIDQDQQVESILASVVDVTGSVRSRQQLEQSQTELQETTEELAASNEELSAINEEMVASNEELASTNEELVSTQEHLHELIGQLQESKERFSFLLNTIPQQVWTADASGAIDYVNQVVIKDFGASMDTIVGEGWQRFIHPEDLPRAMDLWLHAIENGNEYVVEFRLLFADGNYQWHLGRAVPLIENGRIQLWLGTNTNIDLQKINEQKKDEFISIASHELKTPLTSIKAFNQLLLRGGDINRLAGFAQKSADHIKRLEKLIADLLDVTRMNSGKLEYDMQPFSFRQLLTESVENIRHMAVKHEIILKNAVDISFTGDHFRLEQVMNNFLSNAVKYSPQGEKVIVNSALESDRLIVSVQDFGIGIDPTHVNKLFDRYYRVDNTAMRFEGLGLGLFISSEILKRHQGKVWIESELGKGSTFYFSIPILTEGSSEPAIAVDLGAKLENN